MSAWAGRLWKMRAIISSLIGRRRFVVDKDPNLSFPSTPAKPCQGFSHLRWDGMEARKSCTPKKLTRHHRDFYVPERVLKPRPGLIWKALCSQGHKILFSSFAHTTHTHRVDGTPGAAKTR